MEALPSGLPERVGDEEDLARFLTSSSQFTALMVKPSAYLPNPKDRATSVFRHGRQQLEGLRQIARENIAGQRTVHAVAVCNARHVRAAQLDVVAKEPPPRHADVIGWPWREADPELGKAERKERAALLAQHAEFVRL